MFDHTRRRTKRLLAHWFALTTSRRSPVPNMDHVPGRSILSHMTQSHVVFLFPMSPAQRMETKMFLSSRGDTHPPLLHPSITPPSPLHPQWDTTVGHADVHIFTSRHLSCSTKHRTSIFFTPCFRCWTKQPRPCSRGSPRCIVGLFMNPIMHHRL